MWRSLAVVYLIICIISKYEAFVPRFKVPYLSQTSSLRMASMIDFPSPTLGNPSPTPQIDLLYDSSCPICAMQVEFLRKRDLQNRVKYTDLCSSDYKPEEHGNIQFSEGMRKIRAVLPGNKVITGVEVFRETYKAVGLGWVFELTTLPVIGHLADIAYDFWAENRLRITGRGDLAELMKERALKLREAEPVECDADGCGIDY